MEGSQQALTAENGLSVNGLSVNGLSVNGLSVNGLSVNGLSVNGLSVNGLSVNGLSANGLSVNGLSVNGLTDPAAQKFMTYLVSCALPAGRSVTLAGDGTSTTFAGEIGLAPSWETGSCDLTCQRWVSACILARVNHLGVHREISMRGDHKALAVVPHELQLYTEAEATYFANLFQSDRSLYACLPREQKASPASVAIRCRIAPWRSWAPVRTYASGQDRSKPTLTVVRRPCRARRPRPTTSITRRSPSSWPRS